MRDFRDAKAMARALRNALKSRAVETTHSESLELIAKAFGYDNWNILATQIEAAEPRAGADRKPSPAGAHAAPARRMLHCSFCGKSQHDVRKLIAAPSVYICNECAELCMDIVREQAPIWRVVSLLFADDVSGDEAYRAALQLVRGLSTEEVASYVEAVTVLLENQRRHLESTQRSLAMRDGEAPMEDDASSRFRLIEQKTDDELLAAIQETQSALKHYEDGLRIGNAVLRERKQ